MKRIIRDIVIAAIVLAIISVIFWNIGWISSPEFAAVAMACLVAYVQNRASPKVL